MELLDLMQIEDRLDTINGEYGDTGSLCIFCESNDWNGKEGIVHTKDCPMTKLRAEIYSQSKATTSSD